MLIAYPGPEISNTRFIRTGISKFNNSNTNV